MNPAETYILNQPEKFKTILLQLQVLIETTIPSVELLYKYKIPFYYIDGKPFCYLNAAKDYVDVGFWNAAHLTVHLDHMTTAGRKVMKSLRYRSIEEIDHTILIEVLQDAYKVRGKKFWK
ncbi:DUF1801 domain-containing protein [Aquimarina sp. 2201CG5-10]|uniref:DUF1801 domain-containing protein n=1 Tax=Aquimarina callyspongiae TaxID=3098150 RepID=UPI002AB4B1F5|nr:DUF1801 domain-containing protein [Aquimarina sp. 2201CG5-10]MDY8138565.1 DUF1801 domain-containing protein [Aquimarina sp. 2201CG5-10]